MKRTLLLTALMGLMACGGVTTVGADGGTGGTVSVPCTECLTETVSWGPNGGLVVSSDASSLAACRTFRHTRTPSGSSVPSKECSVEIGGCDAEPIAVHEVEIALAHPDVVAALAGSTSLYGTDPRPCDGTVLSISVGERGFFVGGACGAGEGCFAGESCVPIPAGVSALADLLGKLEQQSLKVGECAQVFP